MSFARLPLLLVLILVVLVPVQHWLLKDMTNAAVGEAVSDATQAANATVTRLFVNEIYPRLSASLGLEGTGDNGTRGAPLSGQALESTDSAIRSFMFGTDIMKVKIYAMNGMTVYSTERKQIGEDKHDNTGFQSAAQGIPGSQITHRGTFSSIDGDVFDKDLVASYIPIRNTSGLIIGVAEIYTDRTPVLGKSTRGDDNMHAVLLILQSVQVILLLVLAGVFWMRHGQADTDLVTGER